MYRDFCGGRGSDFTLSVCVEDSRTLEKLRDEDQSLWTLPPQRKIRENTLNENLFDRRRSGVG